MLNSLEGMLKEVKARENARRQTWHKLEGMARTTKWIVGTTFYSVAIGGSTLGALDVMAHVITGKCPWVL